MCTLRQSVISYSVYYIYFGGSPVPIQCQCNQHPKFKSTKLLSQS